MLFIRIRMIPRYDQRGNIELDEDRVRSETATYMNPAPNISNKAALCKVLIRSATNGFNGSTMSIRSDTMSTMATEVKPTVWLPHVLRTVGSQLR